MKRNQILTAILLVLLLTLCFVACACAAEIRPIPVDHDSLDQGNGEFRLSFRSTDRIGNGERFDDDHEYLSDTRIEHYQ